MALFGGLKCYYCGSRSTYSRGTTEFVCTSCDASNFYDRKGNVVDTPFDYAGNSSSHNSHAQYASPGIERKPHDDQLFCDTCTKNQQLFSECISNYLPDDDDPQYPQYEAKLPEYQKELERRYPLVCTRCAPLAQTSIHNADLYSQTSALAQTMRKSRGRQFRKQGEGSRVVMRSFLRILDVLLHASLFAQVAWHAYGAACIHTTGSLRDVFHDGLGTHPSLRRCASKMLILRLTPVCFHYATAIVSRSLLASFVLLWFNPAWRYYWDDNRAIETTYGETQYYGMQSIILALRVAAYYGLGHLADDQAFSADRIKLVHACLMVFLPFLHWLSRQGLGYRKRAVNTKIMPLPDVDDVLGRDAGPAERRPQAQASSMNPLRLFQCDEQPFPVRSLAPSSMYERARPPYGHPSPPASDPPSSDEDAMDIDWRQPAGNEPNQNGWPGTQSHFNTSRQFGSASNTSQRVGWSSMRDETFRLHDGMRDDNERRRQEAEAARQLQLRHDQASRSSPFHGALPPAPMSMERRLRNPPRNTPFQPTKPAAQTSFMSKMREGIEEASTFRKNSGARMGGRRSGLPTHDSDLDGSQDDIDDAPQCKLTRPESAAAREYEIRPGQWTLQQDLDAQATGLEDLFGGQTFRIADDFGVRESNASMEESSKLNWKYVVVAVLIGFFAILGLWLPVRRGVAFYLLDKLEAFERWLLVDNNGAPAVHLDH